MNELKEKLNIKDLIIEVRGKQVILDSDVAYLFKYEVKQLNRQVKRNIERFPETYCFKLTREEYDALRCQNGTSKTETRGGRQYLPYAFTEYGVTMLAGLLKSEVAISTSIKIVNEFILMKKMLNKDEIYINIIKFENKVDDKFIEYDVKFDYLFSELNNNSFKSKLFFNGQIYDAYEVIVDLIKTSKESITIIDNYLDDSILKMLSKKNKNVKVLLITKNNTKINKLDIDKFNKEYPAINIKYDNAYHDRFIIIDNKNLYHLGASIKDLGNKTFAINKIEDKVYLKQIIKKAGDLL